MTTSAAPAVQELDPQTLQSWLDRGQALLIDVREPDEHARERIAAATLNPLSRFNAAAVPFANGIKPVLHCRSGRRSAEAAARLLAAGHTQVYALKGGIEAWKSAGLPVQLSRGAPISIMRQVQITVGTFVILGIVLALTLSPWFLIIPAFMGAGMLFAGLSGTCGMATFLSILPWNRIPTAPAGSTPPAPAAKPHAGSCCQDPGCCSKSA